MPRLHACSLDTGSNLAGVQDPTDHPVQIPGGSADEEPVTAPVDIDDNPIDDSPIDDSPAPELSPEGAEADQRAVRAVMEWVVVLVGAVALALVVRTFLFQPFWIPSESMEQTLLKQDRVMVNKLSYRLGDISPGDVVVFKRPDNDPDGYQDLIKRVIGTPGDVVEGHDGAVFVNGVAIDEPYLDPADVIFDFGPITVPEGEYFMMGDNRDDSYDSRFFGTVPEGNVLGRAVGLFWPLDRIGTL